MRCCAGGGAHAQTWDMPTPCSDATFHTRNIVLRAEAIAAAPDGGLEIAVHSAGPLFPNGDSKNTMRSGQAPTDEVFLSLPVNEDAACGLDSQPFLGMSDEDGVWLREVREPVVTVLLADPGPMPLLSVSWPAQGLCTNGEICTVEDPAGFRFRVVTPRSRSLPPLPAQRLHRSRRPTSLRPSPRSRSRR